MFFGGSKKKVPPPRRAAPPGMRPGPPRPGIPPRPGAIPGARPEQPGAIAGSKYAVKPAPTHQRSKQKMTQNFLFRVVFLVGFLLSVYVLIPNYKIRGPLISFGLVALMFVGVILIERVMWKCPACGKYLGVLPWPGKRCKKCFVKLF